MERNKAWFNVPHMLSGPANFFGPDGPADPTGLSRDFRYQRFLTAVSRLQPQALSECTRLVFEQIWASEEARDADGNAAMSEEVLARIGEEAGLSAEDSAACVEEITAPENKAALIACVEEAVRSPPSLAPADLI